MTMVLKAVDQRTFVDPRSTTARDAAYELDRLVDHARQERNEHPWLKAPVDLLDAARVALVIAIQPAIATAWTAVGTAPRTAVGAAAPARFRLRPASWKTWSWAALGLLGARTSSALYRWRDAAAGGARG